MGWRESGRRVGRVGRKRGVCSKTTPCLHIFGEHVWRSKVDALNSLNGLRNVRKRSEEKGVCSRMTGDRHLPWQKHNHIYIHMRV